MAANTATPTPVTFGATVETPTKSPNSPQSPQSRPALRSPPSNVSDMSAPSIAAAEKDMGIDSTNPFSAFYKHPEARRSMDGKAPAATQSKTHLDVRVYEHDHDVESGLALSTATAQTQQHKLSSDNTKANECTMWPTRQAMLDQKKKNQRARGCNLFRTLNSKQRLWAKIVIGLLIVAAATGLGVGISRAVGGGVWASPNQSKPISSK